ncbi:MAG: tRNA threonylcarbamoyladenosine biosynthesis protein TsaB [Mycobacterium sp.]|nr:tRNA threonylcarbamoyladenosine biosynthesis protein TsaB [Mycobacterium sp.]
MIVLALDTATPAVTAGVVRRDAGEHVLAEHVTVDARAHAETLTPNILAALAESGQAMADLDAVVVGCGPGPFTGLRVGMATAAAVGHALDIPVYGACSLDAIGVRTRGDVLVVTDARRREVYWARYRDGIRIEGPAVNAAADVACEGARAVAGSADHAAMFPLPRLDAEHPTPVGLVRAVDWTADPGPLVPLYLRRPDAKTLAERQAVTRLADGRGASGSSVSFPLRASGSSVTVTIDRLTRADAARCAELEAQLFDGDDPWSASAFVSELGRRHNHYVAARTADKLVGYAGITRLGLLPPHEYEIHTIGVDPAFHGQGTGRRLLDSLLDFADGGTVFLEVRTDNAAAIALYRSAGFVEVGLRKRYYRASGADAYTMRRERRRPARRQAP